MRQFSKAALGWELPLDAFHTNSRNGLTAVMGRMFTSGSNVQLVSFAKSRANGNIGNVPGPKPTSGMRSRYCNRNPHTGHSLHQGVEFVLVADH